MIHEPTDFPERTCPHDCPLCSNGRACVEHDSLFAELNDRDGYAAPAGYGRTYAAPTFGPVRMIEIRIVDEAEPW